MEYNFSHTTLGRTGLEVCRLGLSASYRPGRKVIYRAIDEGVNYLFGFGFDTQMTAVLRDVLKSRREQFVIATGAYNLLLGHPNFRRTLEKRLRKLRTDYIDVFYFLGVTRAKYFNPRVRDELCRLREEGKVRAVGISTHDRKLAGRLAEEGALDVLMIRYNAAHRGAEQDIFPYLQPYNPGIVSFTATRWRYLLRRPRGWPGSEPVPTPSMCYRFVLSHPRVHVCMTAPSNLKHLEQNLSALREGPLSDEEMQFM
ncbi:MAG: aldo/keto reductase, partial [candidate division Zixibacteria bacterium]|nr:aldo/keto reductase [candidate division Zixibacteria bacterium]